MAMPALGHSGLHELEYGVREYDGVEGSEGLALWPYWQVKQRERRRMKSAASPSMSGKRPPPAPKGATGPRGCRMRSRTATRVDGG